MCEEGDVYALFLSDIPVHEMPHRSQPVVPYVLRRSIYSRVVSSSLNACRGVFE